MKTRSDPVGGSEPLLDVRHLKTYFPITAGSLFKRTTGWIKAVDDVSFSVDRGETFGLVGESGSGKTTLGRSVLRLTMPTSGEVIFDGEETSRFRGRRLRDLRRRMQLIFQDPYSSLDPRMTAGSIVGEPLIIHGITKNRGEYQSKVDELFELVGLNPGMQRRYPHEFSGGQRQRIGIARALASSPQFIVCDEPVSALDVSIQSQIINLLEDLQNRFGFSYLFIAHNLAVVRHLSQRVGVLYLGRLVEVTDRDTLYAEPLHPYTQALLSAVPIPDPNMESKRERIVLRGEIPSPLNVPSGCPFHPRCHMATEACSRVTPELRQVKADHWAACIHAPGYGDVTKSNIEAA